MAVTLTNNRYLEISCSFSLYKSLIKSLHFLIVSLLGSCHISPDCTNGQRTRGKHLSGHIRWQKLSRLHSSASHISPDCVNGEGTETQNGTPLMFVSLRLVSCSPPPTTFHDREGPVDTASDFEHAQNLDRMSAGKSPRYLSVTYS